MKLVMFIKKDNYNNDDTMSIDKNNFTMPFENVTIEARWRLDILNPNTGVETLLVVAMIVLSTITLIVSVVVFVTFI